MSIVKMKRLYVISPAGSRRMVLRALTGLGCVEIEKSDAKQIAASGGILHIAEENTQAAKTRSTLESACRLLKNSTAVKKSSLFVSRPEVTEHQLFDAASLAAAKTAADEIAALGSGFADAGAAQAKLSAQIAALSPWQPLDVPLDFTGTRETIFFIGTLPAAIEFDTLLGKLVLEAPACMVELVSSDNEQRYLTVTVHREQESAALTLLKSSGFVITGFKDTPLTAGAQIEALKNEIAHLDTAREALTQKMADCYYLLPALEQALDAYTQEAIRDDLLSATAQTEHTVYFKGWVPASAETAIAKLLREQGCAWALTDPEEQDDTPVLVQNSTFIDPVVSVTDMYDTPAYGSIIDPNPFMFPFYIAFFGFIMADAGYGILMFLGCHFALKLMQPKGNMKRTLTLFKYCGVSTFAAGLLFGGFFGDSIRVFTETFLGKPVTISPLWFDPSAEPMKMLYFSMGLGVVHIILGMGLAAYRMIRQGHVLDALFDVGSWYIVFIGIGLFVLGIDAGKYIGIAGTIMLVLTGGRNSPGIFGKITGGLGSLYGITGYLSDVLSYARIMALGLSGAVVGQVMNQLGTMAGNGFVGLIMFLIVFLVGHTFNLTISLLGAYVHTSRLQYIEFFGKFFEGGGRAFRPLVNHTNYVTIIKED